MTTYPLNTADILRDIVALKAKIGANSEAICQLCNEDAVGALLTLHDQLSDAIPAIKADMPTSSVPAEFRRPGGYGSV